MPEAFAVDRALEFLAGEQLPSGQFPMEHTRLDRKDTLTGKPLVKAEKSVFCSSYVAHSLSYCTDPRGRPMIDRSLEFLEREKVLGTLWRYWCKDAPLHSQIPPDVDDTSCISELLRRLGNGAPDNEELLLANRDSRGLFYTWITLRRAPSATARWWWAVLRDINYGRLVPMWWAGAARGDVDTVVNANVLFYLRERPETEPVIRWLLDTANAGLEASSDRWYRSSPAFYYAVSRCYASGITELGDAKPMLQRSFSELQDPDGRIGENSLQTALAVCAMMNFGFQPEAYDSSLGYLMATQQSDGGWPSFPVFYDGRPTPLISWGSRAVTTALSVEALARVAKNESPAPVNIKPGHAGTA